MKCIRVFGYKEDEGSFMVTRLTLERGNMSDLNMDAYNTIMQIFRLPEGYRNLYVTEGIVSVEQGHLNVGE